MDEAKLGAGAEGDATPAPGSGSGREVVVDDVRAIAPFIRGTAADGGWLNRLYQAASRPYPWRLVDFDVLDAALAIQYGGGYEKLAAILNDADRHWPVPHRAGPDAQRLHKIARAIVDPRYREALTGH